MRLLVEHRFTRPLLSDFLHRAYLSFDRFGPFFSCCALANANFLPNVEALQPQQTIAAKPQGKLLTFEDLKQVTTMNHIKTQRNLTF
jgi:hypothetical protein